MLPEKAVLGYVSAILKEKNVPEKFVPVMAGILSRAYYNQDAGCMEIVTNTYVKKEIAKKAGMKSPGPVGSGLNKLTEAGFLTFVENGVYRLNPSCFGSRPWTELLEIRIQRCFGAEEKLQILAVYSDRTEELGENGCFSGETNPNERTESAEVSPEGYGKTSDCNDSQEAADNESKM